MAIPVVNSLNSSQNADLPPYINPTQTTQPQVSAGQQQVAQSNNQQQEQLGNNAVSSVLNHASNPITNSGWFSSNVTNPINAWGNANLGTAASTGFTASGAATGANLTGSVGTGVGGSDAFLAAPSGITSAAPAWTSASLSGVGAAAGLGYLGGGYVAGWEGGNPQGGSIGGALGAGAGFAFGGPIGAIAGGLIGSTIGGLFGNTQPSDMTQVGGVNISTGQTQGIYAAKESGTGSEFSQQNATIRDQEQAGASNLAQWLLANGATPTDQGKGGNIMVKVGSRDGIQVGNDLVQGGLSYDSNLQSGTQGGALNDAVSKEVLKEYNLTPELKAQLNKINSSTFFNPNFDLQSAISNPASLYSNTQSNAAGSANFTTPIISPQVASQNANTNSILQVPTNNPTGK